MIGEVESYFEIPSGDDYHSIFPRMGTSPELDGVEAAFVVVYKGEVTSMYQTGIPGVEREKLNDALCVILPSGERFIYSDVSRQEMDLPAGAHVGPPPD